MEIKEYKIYVFGKPGQIETVEAIIKTENDIVLGEGNTREEAWEDAKAKLKTD